MVFLIENAFEKARLRLPELSIYLPVTDLMILRLDQSGVYIHVFNILFRKQKHLQRRKVQHGNQCPMPESSLLTHQPVLFNESYAFCPLNYFAFQACLFIWGRIRLVKSRLKVGGRSWKEGRAVILLSFKSAFFLCIRRIREVLQIRSVLCLFLLG